MVNKDRIIPVTRTDLVSLFCTIYNMSNNDPIVIAPVENGTVPIPGDVSEGTVAIAAEPIKTLPTLPEALNAFYFFPAYDFEDADLYLDQNGNKFVPNPGTLCIYDGGTTIKEVDTQTEYTVE